jgi:uncharacterized membrane protein
VKSKLWPLDRDLAVVAALAVAALVVTALPFPDVLRALVCIPFVLVAPGYALGATLFPPEFISRDERATLTVAFSVAAWSIGGLILHLAVDLDRTAWLLLGLAVTIAGVLLAQARRPGPGGRRARRSGTRPRWRALAASATPAVPALVLAVAIAGVAIAIASGGQARELARAHFSSVWIVPQVDGTSDPAERIEVGIQNHEGRDADYTLKVTTKGREIEEWDVQLDSGEAWGETVPAAEAEGPVVAWLYLEGSLERRVKLEFGVPA